MTAWCSSSEIPSLRHSFLFPVSHIRQAQQAQALIGIDLMMKVLISSKWGETQEIDYDNNKMPASYNKLRWEEALISTLQTMLVDMWNERCKIVNAATLESSEMRYRQKAWEFLCEIKQNYWKLSHDSTHLLDRNEWFFKSSTITKVQSWYENIKIEIDRSDRKHTGIFRDIRKFFDREDGYVRVRTRALRLTEAAKLELDRVRAAVQQNHSNIFWPDPGLGR